MSHCKVNIAPSALFLLALFVLFSSPVLLAAILFAALCHELGHYLVLRLMKGTVKELSITAFGAEMKVKTRTGYGGELLITLAGPLANLAFAWCFHYFGQHSETFYVFAGAQAILCGFNLLPIKPLDGSALLWTAIAYFTDPYTADRMIARVGLVTALCLIGFASALFFRLGGTLFFLIAPMILLWHSAKEMGLVKCRRRR